MKAVAEHYIIQTVSRALDLLEQFQEGDAEFGLTDLCTRMNLQKNNVFRLIATLKAKNYIEMNSSTGKYRLGIKTRALGQVATRLIDFSNHTRPYLNELKKQSRETCYFSIIKDGCTYYLDGVESDLPVRVAQRIGRSRPVYCTAAGKIQLAFMAPQEQMELLSGSEMQRTTNSTTTISDVLYRELNRAARQGYAIDDQEHDAGVIEIAAPVFDSHGVIIGALSILGPEMRLTGSRLENELIQLVCQSAARLSSALGHCRTQEAHTKIKLQTPKPKRNARVLETQPSVYSGLKMFC